MADTNEMVTCPRCGGYGGEPGSNFGDYGFHPCYFCGTVGMVTQAAYDADQARANEAYDVPVYGYRPEYDYDDPTCPYCGDVACDPSGTTYACERAHREYEEMRVERALVRAQTYIPAGPDDIPF